MPIFILFHGIHLISYCANTLEFIGDLCRLRTDLLVQYEQPKMPNNAAPEITGYTPSDRFGNRSVRTHSHSTDDVVFRNRLGQSNTPTSATQ